jgi:hypothetical protein
MPSVEALINTLDGSSLYIRASNDLVWDPSIQLGRLQGMWKEDAACALEKGKSDQWIEFDLADDTFILPHVKKMSDFNEPEAEPPLGLGVKSGKLMQLRDFLAHLEKQQKFPKTEEGLKGFLVSHSIVYKPGTSKEFTVTKKDESPTDPEPPGADSGRLFR